MPRDYLHNHPEFADLLRIVAAEKGIDPGLVEKDYMSLADLLPGSFITRRPKMHSTSSAQSDCGCVTHHAWRIIVRFITGLIFW